MLRWSTSRAPASTVQQKPLSLLNGVQRLKSRRINGMWFDVLNRYGNLGIFLSIVPLVSTVLYFVTSSGSGFLPIWKR